MQYKALILALLLIAAAAQGDTPVETTSDAVTSQDATDKPSSAPSKTATESKVAPAAFGAISSSSSASPPGTTKTLNSDLRFPGRYVVYTINIWSDCPNTVWLWVYAPCWFRISYGSYTSQWYPPWQWHQIAITPNCQCTTIRVILYNWWGVPTWINYGTWQSTWNCYNCRNPLQFYNHQKCRCECKRNCCIPSWQSVNPSTCQCQGRIRPPFEAAPIDFATLQLSSAQTP